MDIFLIRLLQFMLAIGLLVLLHEGGHFFLCQTFLASVLTSSISSSIPVSGNGMAHSSSGSPRTAIHNMVSDGSPWVAIARLQV